jgi:hypothetical protein
MCRVGFPHKTVFTNLAFSSEFSIIVVQTSSPTSLPVGRDEVNQTLVHSFFSFLSLWAFGLIGRAALICVILALIQFFRLQQKQESLEGITVNDTFPSAPSLPVDELEDLQSLSEQQQIVCYFAPLEVGDIEISLDRDGTIQKDKSLKPV